MSIAIIFQYFPFSPISYESTHKQERDIIEGYSSCIKNELDYLNSSKLVFLEKHNRLITQGSTIKYTAEMLNKCEELLVHIELEEGRLHGIIGSFLENHCQNAVHQSGKIWIKQQMEKLQEEYNCMAESHKLRYNQIQSQVQFARLAEISEHDEIFRGHKEVRAVKSLIRVT